MTGRHSVVLTLALLAAGGASHARQETRPPQIREDVVRVPAADISITARVLQPVRAPDAARPALVIIQGSGTSDRHNAWAAGFARGFAERGITVVLPDKRGSGDTGGDWRAADFETLAADALAAVRWVRRRSGIDPARVGVLGLSQGGHVAPLAAVRASGDVAFVITVSASTVPMIDQMIDEVEKANERAGVPAEVIAAVTALHRTAEAVAFGAAPFDEYRSRRAALAAGPHGEVVARLPDDPRHWIWNWVRLVGRHDPLPFWAQLRVPALLAYGARDTQIRVARSIARLEPLLTGDVTRAIDTVVFGDTGHPLYEADRPEIRREFLDHAAAWVRAHTAPLPAR